jgi:tRNA(Ile)-lysidine synthase
METKVHEFTKIHRLIEPGDHVMSAVSGGADSVALLVILDRLKTSLNFKLSVCHLNHQLRGEASDADMEFVKNLCQQLHLPCYVGHKDVHAIQGKEGGTLEETARKVRYEFFEEAARQFGSNKLALAHHRDDQCETIIFNLLRGSSFHGLRGIPLSRLLRPDSNIILIRPLLAVSKSDLEDFLRGCGLDWRKDHTNELLYATRNVIRHKLLPMIQEVNPSFREHLLELGRQAGQIETILVEQANKILAASRKDGNEIRIEQWRIKTLPEILACETVRQMLLSLGSHMSRITTRHLREVVTLSTKMELPQEIQARVE